MNDDYLKKIIIAIILVVLLVLSFFLLRPILLSVIAGFVLAFIFTPVYNWSSKFLKSKKLRAALICTILILLFILPIWFLTPVFIDQSIKLYLASQKINFIEILQNIFPNLLASEGFSTEIGMVIQSFVTKTTNSLVNSFSQLIINFPNLLFQFLILFFVFFFVLIDQEEIISYFRSLLPFTKDIEGKLFKSSQKIVSSVIYGQIVIGILQGILTGIGFFIFGVPNALLLTLFVMIAGIFPIVGPTIIWIPIAIYFFFIGNSFSAFGIIIFGISASMIDNFLRPILVSKRTHLHPALVLIGMIGGFFLFGILGFILGPLILAYLIIILEIYRNQKIPGILIQESK